MRNICTLNWTLLIKPEIENLIIMIITTFIRICGLFLQRHCQWLNHTVYSENLQWSINWSKRGTKRPLTTVRYCPTFVYRPYVKSRKTLATIVDVQTEGRTKLKPTWSPRNCTVCHFRTWRVIIRGGVRSTRGLGPTMTARGQRIAISVGMLPQTLIMSRLDQLSRFGARI
jgi:hypothetical protein